MKNYTLALMMVGALALTACDKNKQFETGPDALNAGTTEITPGSASDPNAPAYFQQTIGDRILFAVDQSVLSPQAQELVAQQAAWLMANPDYAAIIEGHADEQGTTEYNIALGARRASAVQAYLIDRGVAPNRLKTVSYGKERPLEICSDETCYAKNRRAVTVLTAGGIS
ncbi:MAG: peptidoglycan-associated lipoprotein Pal [Maritimibacter sp.]